MQRLDAILRECGSVCIGYSGGVDSVFLAAAAVRVLGADNVLAVTGISPAYPAVQRDVARACAGQLGLPHLEIATHELADPQYAANPANRCYFCKSELWPQLVRVARSRGLRVVLDGSNADDAHDYRPGYDAARENGVRSPLLEAGLTKQQIRQLSRQLGLPTWDQPASPCLASRLPYGVAVTPERLRQVEDAEAALRDLGFREFRVRHHDDCLRVEVSPAELEAAFGSAAAVHARLTATGVPRVLLDVEGYRRGALNEALTQLTAARVTADVPLPAHVAADPLPAHDAAGFHRDICVVHDADADTARAHAARLRGAGFRYITVDVATLVPLGAGRD